MRFTTIALLAALTFPIAHTAQAAKVIYESGAFAVRKVTTDDKNKEICKLEVSMELDGQVAAYLALFESRDYYGELFTERKRIGLARESVKIAFDDEAARDIPFANGLAGMDADWRWQYLEDTNNLLDNVKRKNKMRVTFNNGAKDYSFDISLKGSSKAVKELRRCK
ncbi:hypothetical protein [Magnetofaba australis]|uniref:Uncharacterized protein n=1 Tax=Magnetofaba australis IT-1 TaxID=1434232 RepID=A0A1Y2JZS8_9PROT|nr:hypothetical protein [Magnetofaba australis]OSM00366.1 hypothetical protein MAIT1_00867 [Magnetofaba australis IT-1]